MSTENSNHRPTRRELPGRWIAVTVVALALAGLVFGALRSENPSEPAPAAARAQTEAMVIPVDGMSCSACVAGLKRTLKDTVGVSGVHVSLEKREAEVNYDPAKTSAEKLAKVIDELGYKAGTPRLKKKAQ